MQRIFVLGDIHGYADNLKRVLAKAKFDFSNDRLIVLGDIGDRGPDMKAAVEELLKVKNIIFILGNHDPWFIEWLDGGKDPNWELNGGKRSRNSYGDDSKNVPASHRQFFKQGKPYHEETIVIDGKSQKCLFVHGGFDPERPIAGQDGYDLGWDRNLFRQAKIRKIPGYDRIFIGHNRTVHLDVPERVPVTFNNVTMMDTGVDAGGKLSLLDLTNMKLFQD